MDLFFTPNDINYGYFLRSFPAGFAYNWQRRCGRVQFGRRRQFFSIAKISTIAEVVGGVSKGTGAFVAAILLWCVCQR